MALGALAAAIGTAQAALGFSSAQRQQKRTRKAIQRGYGRADERLMLGQRDTRQSTNESLIARGLITGGQEAPVAAMLNTAVTAAGRDRRGGILGIGARGNKYGEAADRQSEANRVANFGPQSGAGMIGERNTLAGSIGGNLSKEFALERNDLNAARHDAIATNNDNFLAQASGAIMGGVQSGLGLYNAFSQPRPGTRPGAGGPAGTGGLSGAFGIDPADPLSSFGTETRVADFKVRPRSS